MFEWKNGLDIDERISQNIKNLIELGKGELAYDRELGISKEWIDKPASAYDAKLITEITEMCNEREPRVTAEVSVEDGDLKVVYEDA